MRQQDRADIKLVLLAALFFAVVGIVDYVMFGESLSFLILKIGAASLLVMLFWLKRKIFPPNSN